MPGNFISPEGDLEQFFVTDSAMIDQYAKTGSLWLAGGNSYGQLGNNLSGSTQHKSSPIQTVAGGTNWKEISGSVGGSWAAIKTDGTLWTWGRNSFGELGDNTTTNASSPIQTVAGGTWKQASASYYVMGGIKTDGTLWLWGRGSYGGLGTASAVDRSSPVQTAAGGNNWKQVSVSQNNSAAIKTDGTLWIWGTNSFGQLGDNTRTNNLTPIQTISGGTNWKQVAMGYFLVGAIKTDGTLWTWGQNTFGGLGTNNTLDRSSPVQTVAGGTNWKSIASNVYGFCAIKTDGTLWNWGYNVYGQLGDNTAVDKSSPVQTVAGGTNWKSVSADYKTVAIKTDGTLWLWGYNSQGGLGDNTIANKSSPIQTVASGTNWKQAAPNSRNFAAIYFYDADNQYPSA